MYKSFPKRACSGTQRISKNYFLSILPSYPDTRFVTEVSTGQTIRIDSIENIRDSINIKNGLYRNKYRPIENAYPRKILYNLDKKDWNITSFNPRTREICFSIGKMSFSYTVPEYF